MVMHFIYIGTKHGRASAQDRPVKVSVGKRATCLLFTSLLQTLYAFNYTIFLTGKLCLISGPFIGVRTKLLRTFYFGINGRPLNFPLVPSEKLGSILLNSR